MHHSRNLQKLNYTRNTDLNYSWGKKERKAGKSSDLSSVTNLFSQFR